MSRSREHHPSHHQTGGAPSHDPGAHAQTHDHSHSHAQAADAAVRRMANPGQGHDLYPPGTELWVHRHLGYHHSAIYLGGDEVVMVHGEPSGAVGALLHGKTSFPTQIEKVSVATFARGESVTIGPFGTAHDPQVAIHRALSKVGTTWQYDPMKHNCQHFTSWCITGSESSPEAAAIQAAFHNVAKAPGQVVEGAEQVGSQIANGIGNLLHHR